MAKIKEQCRNYGRDSYIGVSVARFCPDLASTKSQTGSQDSTLAERL
jgi:hypothetical protein